MKAQRRTSTWYGAGQGRLQLGFGIIMITPRRVVHTTCKFIIGALCVTGTWSWCGPTALADKAPSAESAAAAAAKATKDAAQNPNDASHSQESPNASLARPAQEHIAEELLWLKEETYVITPSKIRETIDKSPASINVVTHKDLKHMGARNIMDGVMTVPGIGERFSYTGLIIPEIRGVRKPVAQDVLVMMNSHALNSNFFSSGLWAYDTLPTHMVKRIEVVRGPGSALYGANAFSGIINVITFDGEEVDGIRVSEMRGSHNERRHSLLFGKRIQDWDVLFHASYYKTHGFDAHIDSDAQTTDDNRFGTTASQAPGRLNTADYRKDFGLKLKWHNFNLDSHYMDRRRDTHVGLIWRLNQESYDHMEDWFINLGYERDINERMALTARVYHNYDVFDSRYQIYPPNSLYLSDASTSPATLSLAPNGLQGSPRNTNTRTGTEWQLTYQPHEQHQLVLGATYEKMRQFDVTFSANYKFTNTPFEIQALGAERDLTQEQNYNQDVSRTFKAVFIEDLWDISDAWRLVLGGRYDRYSDFGGSLNPRAGLIYRFKEHYDAKLLYGRAFRAPNFNELYTQNFAQSGEPSLDPEVVDTWELSMGMHRPRLKTRSTLFHNNIEDSITLNLNKYVNEGEITAVGIENEAEYQWFRGSILRGNYTYQYVTNEGGDFREPLVPRHKGNVTADMRVHRYLNWQVQFDFRTDFGRHPIDGRDPMGGYGLVNTTLLAHRFGGKLNGAELRLSLYNLFDKDWASPSEKRTLPVDYPRPGRTFQLEGAFTF